MKKYWLALSFSLALCGLAAPLAAQSEGGPSPHGVYNHHRPNVPATLYLDTPQGRLNLHPNPLGGYWYSGPQGSGVLRPDGMGGYHMDSPLGSGALRPDGRGGFRYDGPGGGKGGISPGGMGGFHSDSGFKAGRLPQASLPARQGTALFPPRHERGWSGSHYYGRGSYHYDPSYGGFRHGR